LTGLFLLFWAAGSFGQALLSVSMLLAFIYVPLRIVFVLASAGFRALRQRRQAGTLKADAVHPAPAPAIASPSSPAKEFFLNVAGANQGPFSINELRLQLSDGRIGTHDYLWKEGWMGWRKIADFTELQSVLPPPLPPINQAASGTSPPTNSSGSSATATASTKSPTLHLFLKYGTICFCSLLGFMLVRALVFLPGSNQAHTDSPAAPAPTPAPAPPQPLRPEQIAERLRQSTVRIDAGFKVKGLLVDDTHNWLGSGVVFEKSDGVYWILSNAHVVGNDSICNSKLFMDPVVLQYVLVVTMPDGKRVQPSAVLINRYLKDFAVIGVPASTGNYAVLPFGKAQLPQGQKVFAMGHPMGLNGTFTSGVISSWRTLNTKLGKPCEVIQTDATINAGNSGGPLVDDFANLIGINTFTMYRDQNAQGLNFAVSAGEITRSIKAKELVEFPLEPSRIGPFVVQLNRGGSR
jgi:S1-C subfamily serine protease